MGIVNIIVVAVLLLCIIKGYQVGFAQKLLSICSFFVSGICAVSYTHLDVYKRQAFKILDQCNDGIGRKYRNYTEFFSFNQCS